jgi:hypothetical protein
MRKPILWGLQALVIFYFVACSSVEDYPSTQAITPVVTKGNWKVNLYMDANNDKTNDFTGYSFTFAGDGSLKASKAGVEIAGNWYEDNISKRVVINLGNTDPMLIRLNDSWNISDVSNTTVSFENNDAQSIDRLKITSL